MACDSSALVLARADEFRRFAQLARSDLQLQQQDEQQQQQNAGIVMVPPWIHRRRRALEALQKEQQQQQQQEQGEILTTFALGVKEQLGSLQQQLEEQGRQLKNLSVGHCAQASLQQQLVNVLQRIPSFLRPGGAEQEHSKNNLEQHGPVLRERYTIAWLDSQRKHHGRPKHPIPNGFKPIRKTAWFQNDNVSSSARTRTTVPGLTGRPFRGGSTVSFATERSCGRENKAMPQVERRTLPDRRKLNPPQSADTERVQKMENKVPVVAALYAKCRRKARKKSSCKRGRSSQDAHPITSRLEPRKARSPPAVKRAKAEDRKTVGKWQDETSLFGELNDSTILDSMLRLHKREDEYKQEWLVPDVSQRETTEFFKCEAAACRPVEEMLDEWSLTAEDHKSKWLTDKLMDEVLEEIAKEVSSVCEEFVNQLCCIEFF